MGRTFEPVCLSVCLFVCPEHNSKTNDPEVFKRGIVNDFGISQKFRTKRENHTCIFKHVLYNVDIDTESFTDMHNIFSLLDFIHYSYQHWSKTLFTGTLLVFVSLYTRFVTVLTDVKRRPIIYVIKFARISESAYSLSAFWAPTIVDGNLITLQRLDCDCCVNIVKQINYRSEGN